MPDSSKGTILVVDDNHRLRKIILGSLRLGGYHVVEAQNGLEGLDVARKAQPDLIISDIQMPQMDGLQFRDALVADPEMEFIPFIFLTAYDSAREEGLRKGVDDYIVKPFDRGQLLERVGHLLRRVKAFRRQGRQEVDQEITESLKPSVELPQLRGFTLDHISRPARRGGGDYIDFLELDPDNTVVLFGDVMGKGDKAKAFAFCYAGYMRSAIAFMAGQTRSPADIVGRINPLIAKDRALADTFITLFCMIIDQQRQSVRYTNAAHNPPLFLSEGKLHTLKADGTILGLMEDTTYTERELDFLPGDMLILYTDGVVEAEGPGGELYGQERLEALVLPLGDRDGQKVIQAILDDVMSFSGGAQNDDISVVVLRANPDP